MKRYTENELEFIKRNYATMMNSELARILNRNERSIRNKGWEFGIQKSKDIIRKTTSNGWSDKRRKETSEKYKKDRRKHLDVLKILEIYSSGKNVKETAKITGASIPTTRKILIENNISIRKIDYSGSNNYFYRDKLTPEIILQQRKKAEGTRRNKRGGAYLTPNEYSRRRQSETMTMLNKKNGNPMKNPIIVEKARQSLKKLYMEHPEKLLNAKLRRNYMTSLEKAVKMFLDGLGLKEGSDYLYNKYLKVNGGWKFPDFRIESKKLCIECDGEKWHDDLEIEAEIRDNLIRRQGYDIIHLDGKEIQNGDFKYKLLKVLN